MSNPFMGSHRFMTIQETNEIVRSVYSREQELRRRCREAHDLYVDLSIGKDEDGHMNAIKRASIKYGLNYSSIYKGRPIAEL